MWPKHTHLASKIPQLERAGTGIENDASAAKGLVSSQLPNKWRDFSLSVAYGPGAWIVCSWKAKKATKRLRSPNWEQTVPFYSLSQLSAQSDNVNSQAYTLSSVIGKKSSWVESVDAGDSNRKAEVRVPKLNFEKMQGDRAQERLKASGSKIDLDAESKKFSNQMEKAINDGLKKSNSSEAQM